MCFARADFCVGHCEFGEGLWLQVEGALQTDSSRDAEPHSVIPPKTKKNLQLSFMKLKLGITFRHTTTDPYLPIIAWICIDICYSRSSQLEHRNPTGQCFSVPGCVALPIKVLWKQGAAGAAADRSQISHSEACNLTALFEDRCLRVSREYAFVNLQQQQQEVYSRWYKVKTRQSWSGPTNSPVTQGVLKMWLNVPWSWGFSASGVFLQPLCAAVCYFVLVNISCCHAIYLVDFFKN